MLEEQECFHSYLPGGPKNVKIFAHVAVLPHMELNTNRYGQYLHSIVMRLTYA